MAPLPYTLVLEIAGTAYYIQSTAIAILPSMTAHQVPGDEQYIPATFVSSTKKEFGDAELHAVVEGFRIRDDVWSAEFMSMILLRASGAVKISRPWCPIEVDLEGPCIVKRATGEVFSVYKIVEDTHSAFITSILIQLPQQEIFTPFGTACCGSVAVPSRLYSPAPTASKPLSGLRFAVKDLLHVAGLKTGLGSKAYHAASAPAERTAEAVMRLLAAGAILLGKTKTSMFAAGVDPPSWTDYECPHNPRGDGLQSPSGSSSGSAVAVAAYAWCDFSIGTDTGGSTRAPGGANGIFANRFSSGAVSGEGVWCVAERLDALGVFARTPEVLVRVCTALLPASLPQEPWGLLCPIDARFRWGVGKAGAVLETAVKGIERVLGCQRAVCNVEELWAKENKGSIDDAVGGIYSILSETGTLSSPELSSFLGTDPPMDAVVRRRHEWARGLSSADILNAVDRMEIFREWVETSLFGRGCVLVFPQALGLPVAREETRERLVWDKFSIYAFGYAAGCAEIVVPVGEVDGLPVCLSLVARRGCDGSLLRLLEDLASGGVLGEVKAGKKIF